MELIFKSIYLTLALVSIVMVVGSLVNIYKMRRASPDYTTDYD